ncbi:AC78-like protein [Orgyia pseudotsugata single capsid nuclopolyhedrovirus]|nr:AC78-like protein [Orgyia pseudotsugata single capsid nuclopolyhedrovirus]
MEIPYERLGTKTAINYIPMKMALNDDKPRGGAAPNTQFLNANTATANRIDYTAGDNIFYENDNRTGSSNGVNAVVIALVSVVCVLVVLYAVYAIYVFIILRDRQNTIAAQRKFF